MFQGKLLEFAEDGELEGPGWWWQLGLVAVPWLSSGRVDCLAAMHEIPLLSFCIALKKALSGSNRTSTALCHSTVQSESTAQGCGSSGSSTALCWQHCCSPCIAVPSQTLPLPGSTELIEIKLVVAAGGFGEAEDGRAAAQFNGWVRPERSRLGGLGLAVSLENKKEETRACCER